MNRPANGLPSARHLVHKFGGHHVTGPGPTCRSRRGTPLAAFWLGRVCERRDAV